MNIQWGYPKEGEKYMIFEPMSCHMLETTQDRDIVTVESEYESYVLYQSVTLLMTSSDPTCHGAPVYKFYDILLIFLLVCWMIVASTST